MPNITDLFKHAPQAIYKGVKAESRYLTMQDGTQIAIDVMLPANLPGGEHVPAVMIMARYWRSMELRVPNPPNKALIGPRDMVPDYLIPRGFALVVVDGRGSGASMGVSRYPWSPEELSDYAEVAQWAAGQPWCNGNIGAYGISYEGATALRLVMDGVKGVIPQEIEFDVYTDVALPGGIFNSAFINEWNASNQKLDNGKPSSLFPFSARLLVKSVRPVDDDKKTRTRLKQAIQAHQGNTDVFKAMSGIIYRDDEFGDTGATLDDFSVFALNKQIEASRTSLFNWGSWMDGAAADAAIKTFNTYSNPQITVIGAWKHEMSAHGSPFQKPKAKPNPSTPEQWGAMAQFFQQTLKNNQPLEGKTLYYYTLGEEAWKQTDAFPLPNIQMQAWYFHAGKQLKPEMPEDHQASDRYTVNFETSTGNRNRWHTQMAKPVVYQNRAKEDARLLTYTSAPLEHEMEITGYPVVTLHVASNEPDGAFFVYLEDVDPQGVVRYITEGELRGIHRKLSDEVAPYWCGMPYRTFKRADAAPLPIGETVELTFGLQPTSALIKAGHCIRVAIAGADQDTFARIGEKPVWEIAHASHIRLPVQPR